MSRKWPAPQGQVHGQSFSVRSLTTWHWEQVRPEVLPVDGGQLRTEPVGLVPEQADETRQPSIGDGPREPVALDHSSDPNSPPPAITDLALASSVGSLLMKICACVRRVRAGGGERAFGLATAGGPPLLTCPPLVQRPHRGAPRSRYRDGANLDDAPVLACDRIERALLHCGRAARHGAGGVQGRRDPPGPEMRPAAASLPGTCSP
jgi:hypothetical protein